MNYIIRVVWSKYGDPVYYYGPYDNRADADADASAIERHPNAFEVEVILLVAPSEWS